MERDRRKMKGKRVIAGILLAGILAVTLAGCKNTDNTKEETEKPVITLGSDSYPPYNYLNEDGVPTGIDVELATEAFKRMGYQVEVVQINWEEKKELVESGEIDCIMGCFSMEGRLDDYRWAGPYIASRQALQAFICRTHSIWFSAFSCSVTPFCSASDRTISSMRFRAASSISAQCSKSLSDSTSSLNSIGRCISRYALRSLQLWAFSDEKWHSQSVPTQAFLCCIVLQVFLRR